MDVDALLALATSEIIIRGGIWFLLVLVGGVMGVLGTLWFGRGYKERISRLENRLEDRQPVNTTIQNTISFAITKDGELVNVAQDTSKPLVGPIVEVFPQERLARFGTKQGTLEIRYGDDAMIIHDIAMMLHKNGIMGVLESRNREPNPDREQQ